MIAYVNGQFLPEEDASVSVFDRGFLFADAVYEVTAIINGKLVDFDRHMARLQRSCAELQLSLPYDLAELKQIHLQLVQKNNIEEGLVYLQLTRGNAHQRSFLYPDKQTKPTLVLFAQKTQIVENEKSKYGIKVVTVDDIRWQRCDIKTVALLAASMAKEYAKQQGADDAIFVKNGYITEGSSSNCFIINQQNQIQTRGLNNEILSGITRQAILQLAREQQIDIVEKPFSIDEMLEAKEVFITSATTLVWPVIMANNQFIGEGKPGKLAIRLREIYLQKLK
ncbi:D-amino-acid transaminase [Providencia hangzhouensis]|uniref:Aminodeoxychorismate lyase n=1 Tax=Providencia rettgeri TaxID=587 RepID=A0A809SHV4_PRORE|nr:MULTISPECIES: D-amino-acid transaminase [Providencia]MRF65691.1 D-amino-acid transaminase [Escherichia coli]EFE53869.1 putative D-amino-acid transaminase [Providencia rettgeri DSM 1131]MBG5893302.1 D-amino-acid transaminase [Providencia rettgeri]MBG5927600.1 D-amino-acid transaminase [Providencia rettgeri]MBN7842367.1 D-amino-acid transaminase [Providencia rettgeri]